VDLKFELLPAVEVNEELAPTSVPPLEKGGRMFVAVADVARALGATVDWDAPTRTVTVTKADRTIRLVLDSVRAHVNGQDITLDVAPFTHQGRTMMPLRFIAEQLGAQVTYDAGNALVRIVAEAPAGVGSP
jgi:hypothetical protein